MRALLLELNEFNASLLQEASFSFGLKNIQRLFSFYQTETHTPDCYDSGYLEPWVQWVSVHTGQPSTIHQIQHLGDVPDQGCLQIWETLSAKGISSGIWGAMNAKRRSAPHCLFFLPDPWTVSEEGFPPELNALLQPLRYMSQHYTQHAKSVWLSQLGALWRLFRNNQLGGVLVKEVGAALMAAIQYGTVNKLDQEI